MIARQIAVNMTLLLALSMPAAAQKTTLILGTYLPTARAGGVERVTAVERLAALLSKKSGYKILGRSFARRKDLLEASRRRQLQLAIVPAPFAAASRWPALLVLSRDARSETPWEILSHQARTVGALKGKTIAVPDIGFPSGPFVVRVLLAGEVDPSFFRWLVVADAASAASAVRLGRVAAAAVPEGLARPKRSVVFRSDPVMHPVLVAMKSPPVPATVQSAIIAALVGQKDRWLGYSGWKRPPTNGLASLRETMRRAPAPKRLVAAMTEPYRLGSVSDVLPRLDLRTTLPSIFISLHVVKEAPSE